MVKSGEDGRGSVPPFLKKCYDMVDDEATDSIVSWGKTGQSFVIWNMTDFSVQLLPKFFKHNNFSSFMRQLNIYGFRKTDTDRWEFANEGFIRGQKHLLKNISRRKHTHSSDQPKSAQQDSSVTTAGEKTESFELWKEVENLKTDKKALAQELVKLRQHQESANNKLLLLRDSLQGMEKNQQQMLSFLVMAMQNPGILVQLLHPKEKNWRMAEAGTNMLEHDTGDDDATASDGMIVRYQPIVDETSNPGLTPAFGSEKQPESDNSFNEMNDYYVNVDFMKTLMDEKFLDNHAPLILPDIPDDFTWEQLLLTNPFSENVADVEQDKEESLDSEMEMEPTAASRTQLEESQKFDLLIKEMEEFQTESTENGSHMDQSLSVERLAEQIEHLASEP